MSDSESVSLRPNGLEPDDAPIDDPVTPVDHDDLPPASSQVTLPSTEAPASPIDDPNESFKTEINDDQPNGSAVIPSSLTPPPSSQVPTQNGNGNGTLQQPGFISSQRSNLFSPPATTLNTLRRDAAAASNLGVEYVAPTARQVLDASADELRSMMQSCIAEQTRLKMEAAHFKLQFHLLSLQADEYAKRAAVEHEMTRREVEALRAGEHSRQARRELSNAPDSLQSKYLQMKTWYDAAVEENDASHRRLKLAKKVIQQKEEEIVSLTEERDMMLNRIRENREHFHMLCSPGGIFHGAMTPKQQAISTPQQYRATPRQTPKSIAREARPDREDSMAALLQAVSQENNSAPSTPTTSHRPAARMPSKHIRNVQSLSSLPTTPTSRPRGEHSVLLPSVDLVPQTEPARRYSTQRFSREEDHLRSRSRKSRESTISADDNEDLAARQARETAVQVVSILSQASRASQASRGSGSFRRSRGGDEEDEEVFESQASQAASEMLRRDPRESFEVASSGGSRDGTPAPVEKSATLQAKLFSSLAKAGGEKRKFSGGATNAGGTGEETRRELPSASPTKKARVGSGAVLGESPNRVGLGILQSQ